MPRPSVLPRPKTDLFHLGSLNKTVRRHRNPSLKSTQIPKFPVPWAAPRNRPRFRYYVAVLKSVELYLRKHRLVRPGQRIGVAVSGGADSVALLRAFAELAPSLGVVLYVLHLNHNLRGPASQDDARFVGELASQLSLDCAIESEDVASLSALLHLSLEAAGRRARYGFFMRAAVAHRLDSVATAHTLDDQAETVLLRLLRGTGTSGLAGIHRSSDLSELAAETSADPVVEDEMPPQSPRLIRPLLSTTRQQVEEYLHPLDQPFRQDVSNLEPQFLRNRVRGQLLPSLERDYNPRLREALCETAEVAAAENAFLEELASTVLGVNPMQGLPIPDLQAQPLALQRRILRRICRPHALALDFAHLEALRDFALAGCAERLKLPKGFVAEVVREKHCPPRLFLRPPKQEQPSKPYFMELPIPGKIPVGKFFGTEMYVSAELLAAVSAEQIYNRASLLSSAQIGQGLAVRNLLPGDRFHPQNSGGERKINRLLQELSIPAMIRQGWPVVLSGKRIVWVPGLPVAAHAAWTLGEGAAIILAMDGGEGGNFHG
jgi:tRNA(Ile)-lysidine synthase